MHVSECVDFCRNFVKEKPAQATDRFQMWTNFDKYILEQFHGGEPSDEDWDMILDTVFSEGTSTSSSSQKSQDMH